MIEKKSKFQRTESIFEDNFSYLKKWHGENNVIPVCKNKTKVTQFENNSD